MATGKGRKGRASSPCRTVKRKDRRRCGLCGNTTKLMRTECCGHWICDDEDQYVLFSYARNSCSRNHRRFTLCGYHHTEGHTGDWQDWQDCQECRDDIDTEMYVWYGTNEYNFEKLKNPPTYEPTKCAKCGTVIVLGEEAHSRKGDEYFCQRCTEQLLPGI